MTPRWTTHPLRIARQRAGVTQSGLARATGISRGTVLAIEQGQTRTPKTDTLTKIAAEVRMDPAVLKQQIIDWLAAEVNITLSPRARATLQLTTKHIAHFETFSHWREQIVDTPTAFSILLRLNADVILRYEHGKQKRGMPDKLAGALMNVLGLDEDYLAAVQALPVTKG